MPFDMPHAAHIRPNPKRHEERLSDVERSDRTPAEELVPTEERIAAILERYIHELISAGDFHHMSEVPSKFVEGLETMYHYCEKDAKEYRALTAPIVAEIVRANGAYLDEFEDTEVSDRRIYERDMHQAVVQEFLDYLGDPRLLPGIVFKKDQVENFGQVSGTIPVADAPRPPIDYAHNPAKSSLSRGITWMQRPSTDENGESLAARVDSEVGDGDIYKMITHPEQFGPYAGVLEQGVLHRYTNPRTPKGAHGVYDEDLRAPAAPEEVRERIEEIVRRLARKVGINNKPNFLA